MGNGAKAAQRRERNQKEKKVAKSQLKGNVAACNISCNICKQSFLQTAKAPILTSHAENKHGKTMAECFPDFQG
ncbi:hypothetical protein VUR80DRAFT_617 [Thermomyces stellatus]